MKPAKHEQYILCLEKTEIGDLCELYVEKDLPGYYRNDYQLTPYETAFTFTIPVIGKFTYYSPTLQRNVSYPLLKTPKLNSNMDFIPCEAYSLIKRIIKVSPQCNKLS